MEAQAVSRSRSDDNLTDTASSRDTAPSGGMMMMNSVVLPAAVDLSPERVQRLRAFGRAMVKVCQALLSLS